MPRRRAHAHDRQDRGRDAAEVLDFAQEHWRTGGCRIVVAGDADEVRRCAARQRIRTCA